MAEEISEKVKAFLSFNLNLETAIEDYQSRRSQASMAEFLGWEQDTKKEDFPLATAYPLSHFATYLDTDYVEDDEELDLGDLDDMADDLNFDDFDEEESKDDDIDTSFLDEML